jgi:hypothetical protein
VNFDPHAYTADEFFGIRWRWDWDSHMGAANSPAHLAFLCPQCDAKSPLDLRAVRLPPDPGEPDPFQLASMDFTKPAPIPRCRWCGERLVLYDDWRSVVAAVRERIATNVAVGGWKPTVKLRAAADAFRHANEP